MNVSSRYLVTALRSAAIQAKKAGARLREQLVTNSVDASAMLAGGSLMSDASGGHSTTFASFGAGHLTSLQIVETWAYLVDRYDEAVSELGDDVELDVMARMELRLRPVTGTTSNWMYLSK